MNDAFSRMEGPEGLDEGALRSCTLILGLGGIKSALPCIV